MSEESRTNWRDLCSAVIEAKDPDEVLELVVRINQILEWEEQGHRSSISAGGTDDVAEEGPC